MEDSIDREEEIPSDDYVQQYAIYTIHTIRSLGTKFWEWCGHTKDKVEEFLSLKQTDDLNENWVEVDEKLQTRITETPQQLLYEQIESYGTASDEESDDEDVLETAPGNQDLLARISELEKQLEEYKTRAEPSEDDSVNEEDDDDDADDSSDDDDEQDAENDSNVQEDRQKELTEEEALERDSDQFDERVTELLSEKETLESELEKARLLLEQREAASENVPVVDELKEQLYASRKETNRLLSLLNAYNGVGLCSKFKTEKEVQELMLSMVPNEYTSAIELLESSYQMDPDEDTRPYDICLQIFENVFLHTKQRQSRFFEIIHNNSVFKIDMLVAQKVFWGLIQEHFELLGITPVEEVVSGILEVSAVMEHAGLMSSDVEDEDEDEDDDADEDDDEFGDRSGLIPPLKYRHFVGIECDGLEEILNHSIMREYMMRCAEISFFVLWSKMPRLALRGWKLRGESDAVFDRKIHERIWGDSNPDNKIRAVVLPALYRVESEDGMDDELVPVTKRFVFCSGMAE